MSKTVTKISIALAMCRPLNSNDNNKHTHFVCVECNSTISGQKQSNIVAHMESKHLEIFRKRLSEKAKTKFDTGAVEIRRLRLIQNMTESVTRNGRPLAMLCDTGYRKIIQKELEALQKTGHGTGFTDGKNKCPPVVLDHIKYLSTEIIDAVKLEINGLLLSLMIDIGSRNGRDILGISIQYMHHQRVVIRSLGMILFKESHTALNIKNKLMACLTLFGIKPNRIVSITSDNASNMIAMVKTFNQAVEDEQGGIDNDADGDDDESDANDEFDIPVEEIEDLIHEYFENKSMTEDEEEREKRRMEALEILDESAHFLDLLKELQNDFIMYTLNTHGIKCAAHTLQLAVNAALRATKIHILINMCRIVCKLVRKKKYKNKMREKGMKPVAPPLDCKVRWNSTFKMVCSSSYIGLIFPLRISEFCPF